MKQLLGSVFLILLIFSSCDDLAFRDYLDRIVNERIAKITYYSQSGDDCT